MWRQCTRCGVWSADGEQRVDDLHDGAHRNGQRAHEGLARAEEVDEDDREGEGDDGLCGKCGKCGKGKG